MAIGYRPLLCVETSVFGFGCGREPGNAIRHGAAFARFEQVRLGRLNAAASPVTFLELDRAAGPLRSGLTTRLGDVRILDAAETAVYLDEQVIPRQHLSDARHEA